MPLLNANTFSLLTDPVTLTLRDLAGAETVVVLCMMTARELSDFEQEVSMQDVATARFHVGTANLPPGVAPAAGWYVVAPNGDTYRVLRGYVQCHGTRHRLDGVMESEA